VSLLGILKAKGLALNLGTHALPLPEMPLVERIAEGSRSGPAHDASSKLDINALFARKRILAAPPV